jgi:hypothetical protein
LTIDEGEDGLYELGQWGFPRFVVTGELRDQTCLDSARNDLQEEFLGSVEDASQLVHRAEAVDSCEQLFRNLKERGDQVHHVGL